MSFGIEHLYQRIYELEEIIKSAKTHLEHFPSVEEYSEGIGFNDIEPTYRQGRNPRRIDFWLSDHEEILSRSSTPLKTPNQSQQSKRSTTE